MHEILALRQQVFVVEQNCVYLDADDLDSKSWHLVGRAAGGQIGAYTRLTFPATRFNEPSIGRVLTAVEMRKKGLAREAVNLAIAKCEQEFPGQAVKISAQLYLKKFYNGCGFKVISEPYDEDGIEHIDMLRMVSE